jgi:hypothetical protein
MSSEQKDGAKRKGGSKTGVKGAAKPKIAVFKFASCDGCQLSLLDAEDELLAITDAVDIAYFPEASRAMLKGPYDIGSSKVRLLPITMRSAFRRSGASAKRWSRLVRVRQPAAFRRFEIGRMSTSSFAWSTPRPSSSAHSSCLRQLPSTFPWTSNCVAARSTSIS